MVELFEYFVRIVGKPVSSFELSLRKKTLLEFEIAVTIVESPFERITKHFIGLGDLGEMEVGGLLIFLGEAGMPPQDEAFVLLRDFVSGGIVFEREDIVVVLDHLSAT